MIQSLKHTFFLTTLLLAFLVPHTAKAIEQSAEDDSRHVEVHLIADTTEVSPEQTITIGIVKKIDPHWHTYWINPGDSGEATRISWEGLDGLQFEPIQWPAPTKIPFDPLLNYGYEGKVTLLQNITFPNQLPDGPITLHATISMLVCEEICIPEISKHTITFNAGQFGDPSAIAEAQGAIPTTLDWNASYKQVDNNIAFEIDGIKEQHFSDVNSIEIFPLEQGLIANAQPAYPTWKDEKLIYTQEVGELDIASIPASDLVITYLAPSGNRKAVQVSAQAQTDSMTAVAQTSTSANDISAQSSSLGFLSAIAFALIGGMILNLMPCVFPVLSLKALKLVQIKDSEEKQARAQGIAYTAGVILSFMALATILIILQAAGAQIGWGFQLQNPIVIGALIYLVFALGLNLSGMFEISLGRFANVGASLTQKDGASGSFFTGVLATAVATPCTAPFMGAAMAYALAQPAYISLSVFFALGFGLALPYLCLCYIPALRHALPKPGAWMNTFKQFLAFPMFATAAWLVWVLSQQTGHSGVLNILMGAVVLSLGFWVFSKGKRPLAELILLAALVPLFLMQTTPYTEGIPQEVAQSQNWQAYTPERLELALNETDEPVFVNMTAAWCITCKVNERVALNTADTKMLFADLNIQYFKGDWTNKDAQITQFLQRYGRQGVPLYVYHGARDPETGLRPEPKLLPQLLTPKIVREAITD